MSKWQQEITGRIRHALDLAASPKRVQLGTDYSISPARLAQGIGEAYIGPVQGWIEGTHEPSISQIQAVARWCGVDEGWLVSGDGAPYHVEYERIPENPGEGAMALLAGQGGDITTLKALRFFRREGQRGDLMFLRHYRDGTAKVFTTPYVVPGDLAAETGGGGRSSLKSLLLTWEMLYAIYTESHSVPNLTITSHVISEDLDRQLRQGNDNPLALIERLRSLPWWEDIWDSEQISRANYWPGWRETCAELQVDLERDRWAASVRDQIKSLADDPRAFGQWLAGKDHNLQPETVS
ncbi:hypothetical protein AA0488_1016 [Kozakia baliensis NRIC 0488]|nr:hypothetical protein AA0488_1016 [Kozakia baliensis NRIC 0488]